MSLPIPCEVDGTLSLTCFYSGSVRPTLCPNGTLCGTPFMPPLPAPPGYAQGVLPPAAAPQVGRTLVNCSAGEWCGLGRAVSEGPALACPAGAACSDPALLEPLVCDLGGNCSAAGCPHIPYCPAGSTAEALCPPGEMGWSPQD